MTFSVIARDPEHNLFGIAQATSPLAVGGRCPFIRANVGAVCVQAATNPGLGPLAIELLALGHSPDAVLKQLADSNSDFSLRQVGVLDRLGRAAVHTGSENEAAKGSFLGRDYIVMGNGLANEQTLRDMHAVWKESQGQLFEDRLFAVITAGRDAGGDKFGHRSAAIIVYGNEPYPRTSLRVDYIPHRLGSPDAVDALGDLLETWRPLIPYYEERPYNARLAAWQDWLAANGRPFKE